ncbi:Tim44 domain-containing protein [Propionivibrio dicarboxylicus]|uniref:Predicted lipid-binding transport protein, Tim44 family n=1 Tax=Propionivibrio dicarboxylicus TaxID=83767 RepID=A0A1G7W6K6_9RHOO|nr:Tim44-like domain-containing protein [Propionivibrio dicarboxylicus]SDG67612.1 Predicted lipid-binding transport protein, Tim44 family [Propionivibrio dicarboxylicus]
MKKFFAILFVAVAALSMSVGDAEAARLGGGRSIGMQRQAVTPRPVSPTQQAAPAPVSPAPTAAPAPAAQPKRSWLGPIAGLAAGLGLGALLSHFGLGAGFANFLMMALLAMAAVFVFKLLFRRNAQPASEPLQYAGMGNGGPVPSEAPPAGVATSGAATPVSRIPEGFDVDGFLRVAKLNFVRLQAANDAKNIDDIREFVAPEIYAGIKLEMDERGSAPQQTDVVTLNAELLEVVTEGHQHIASVRFTGMIRESTNAAAAPFDEIWNLSKSVDGSRGWVVAGIQQLA